MMFFDSSAPFCIHLNGQVTLPEGRRLSCRDFAQRVFLDENTRCMRNWTSQVAVLNDFSGSKPVTQIWLNQLQTHICNTTQIGDYICSLFAQGFADKYLIALNRHMVTMSLADQGDCITFEVYDPNHTNQVYGRLIPKSDLEQTLARTMLDSGVGLYSTPEHAFCVLTQPGNIHRSIQLPSFSWYTIGMMLRFSKISELIALLKKAEALPLLPSDLASQFQLPRQILPFLDVQSLVQYLGYINHEAEHLSVPYRLILSGMENRPTTLDAIKANKPEKLEALINALKAQMSE